jgi:ferredoxin
MNVSANLSNLLYLIVGSAVAVLFLILMISSYREKHCRATRVSTGLLVLFITVWFGAYWFIQHADPLLFSASGAVLLFAILFFAPIGGRDSIRIDTDEASAWQVDERDVIFAREEYAHDKKKYETYYARRPEYRDRDDKICRLPELLAPGGRLYNPITSPRIGQLFRIIESLTHEVDGSVSPRPTPYTAEAATEFVKRVVKNLGADDVGIAELNRAYVYSHVGRGPEPWGEAIENSHRYVIVFALEMDSAAVESAPDLPITEESATQYLKGSQIATHLARLIRSLGYPARAHVAGSNYQIMLPPLAYNAGLGELGRMGYLISKGLGGRVRLGAVTTDLPLNLDRPIAFGVQDFCRKCKKCAVNCPSAAIPHDQVQPVRGVHKWQLDIEQCLHLWRVTGTDCGLCMRVCPYSHPPTFIHNLIRAGLFRSAFARTVSVWGDDLLYGRKVKF